MPASILRSLARVVLLALMILASAVAQAQQPKLEMHRLGVNADDGSGWHPAVSTKGSFSILMPIPFNDFTTRDAGTGEVTHAVGGKSSEGIKFAAVWAPLTSKTPQRHRGLPPAFSVTTAHKGSEI